MKKLYYFLSIALCAALLFMHSCATNFNENISENSPEDGVSFTIAEAKQFFEQQYTEICTRSAGINKHKGRLSPGDFTPQWNKAVVAANDLIECVNIPIISHYGYRAARAEFVNGRSRTNLVNVTQKLLVVKGKNGDLSMHLLSLIPDKKSVNKQTQSQFIHAGAKNSYSGLAVYSSVRNAKISLVKNYVNGEITQVVCTGNAVQRSAVSRNCHIDQSENPLDGIVLMRGGGWPDEDGKEDKWDCPVCHAPLFGGVCSFCGIDGDGNKFCDKCGAEIDENGDCECIPESCPYCNKPGCDGSCLDWYCPDCGKHECPGDCQGPPECPHCGDWCNKTCDAYCPICQRVVDYCACVRCPVCYYQLPPDPYWCPMCEHTFD